MKTYKILYLHKNHMGNLPIMVADLSETEDVAGNLVFSITGFDQFIFPWDSLEAQNMLHVATNGDGYVDLDISSFKHRKEIDGGTLFNRYFHNSIYQ